MPLSLRTDTVIHCELSDEERTVYDAIRVSTQQEVIKKLNAGGNIFSALEALLRLRQAACHSGMIPGVTANTSSKTLKST